MSEELTTIAWHSKRCWNFCMSEDEKKYNQFLASNAFDVYNLRVLEHFSN